MKRRNWRLAGLFEPSSTFELILIAPMVVSAVVLSCQDASRHRAEQQVEVLSRELHEAVARKADTTGASADSPGLPHCGDLLPLLGKMGR
ncbi:MAG TPA: hypothetical protein ENK10_01010 [Acidobacteria bacterium]|nr:hypothetical protein [Acidobacteriota bacterium]